MPEHQNIVDPQPDCPECDTRTAPVAPLVLMAVGGLLLFFSLFFGLVGAIAEDGFLILAAVVFIVATVMMAIGIVMYKKDSERRHQLRQLRMMKARCQYCGTQNRSGARRCDSCGAPLR